MAGQGKAKTGKPVLRIIPGGAATPSKPEPAGQKFVVQARVLLHEWERLAQAATREETTLSGRYVLGCHPSVGLYTLPGLVPKLLTEHPELDLKLVHGLSRQITDEVIGFKV